MFQKKLEPDLTENELSSGTADTTRKSGETNASSMDSISSFSSTGPI